MLLLILNKFSGRIPDASTYVGSLWTHSRDIPKTVLPLIHMESETQK